MISATSELSMNWLWRISDCGTCTAVSPSDHMPRVAALPLPMNALFWIVARAPLQTNAVPHSTFLDTTSVELQSRHSSTDTLNPYVLSPSRQQRAATEAMRASRFPSITRCSRVTLLVEAITRGPHLFNRSEPATSTAPSGAPPAQDRGVP